MPRRSSVLQVVYMAPFRFRTAQSPLPPSSSSASSSRVSSREIWNLTWPQAVMMLFQFLVGFTDVVVAGRISSEVQATLGLITQCQFFLLVVVIALCNGGIAAMSQSLGARLPRRAERYVGLIFQVAFVLCVLTVLFGYFFRENLFNVLDVPTALRGLIDELWLIFLAIIPGNYLMTVTTAVFRAHKNVWVPLFSGIVVCVVNGFFDFGFGLGYFGLPNFGAHGIAWATLVAVSAGALFNIFILYKKQLVTSRSFAPFRWQRRALPYIAKVALPAGGLQILWQLGYLVLFYITSTLPDGSVIALAGLTAGMRIEAILFLPAFAFNSTGSVLVGHCLGAGNKSEARRVGLRVTGAGALSMSVAAAFLYPWLVPVIAFVVPDPAVQPVALSYMHYNLVSTPFTVTSMIMSGIMTGAGATIYLMIIYSAATWCIRLPLAWYLGHIVWMEASGIFLAMLVSQIAQAASAMYVFLRLDWYRFASTAKRFTRDKE